LQSCFSNLYVFASSLCTSAVVDVVVVVVAVVVVVVVAVVVVVVVVVGGGGVGAVVYCRVNVIFSLEVVSTVDVVDVVVVAVVVGVVDVVSGGIDVETLRIETSICSIRENSSLAVSFIAILTSCTRSFFKLRMVLLTVSRTSTTRSS